MDGKVGQSDGSSVAFKDLFSTRYKNNLSLIFRGRSFPFNPLFEVGPASPRGVLGADIPTRTDTHARFTMMIALTLAKAHSMDAHARHSRARIADALGHTQALDLVVKLVMKSFGVFCWVFFFFKFHIH